MATKEESSRLLSKVAKFVRNPLKDWSELDGPESGPALSDAGYSREALKEMIERRQRNDFVRRREFDVLRRLRQREAAGGREGGAPSSFQLNSLGKTDGRALTLKKIDEIEEQMSQQWWKGRGGGDEAVRASQPDPLAAQHARAYADTAPGAPSLLDEGGAAGAPGLARLVCETAVQEAALRFARGDDAGAEGLLQQAVAGSGAYADDDDTWRALLDLYRATGDAEKFAVSSTRYAQRFKRPAPEWVSLRLLAHHSQSQDADEGAADWYAPEQLGREGLVQLTRALAQAGPVWRLDWRLLRGIQADAAAPLGVLFTHWADSPVQLRFTGADRLVAVLAEATPLTVRGTDLAWWRLYLSVLRAMNLPDDFELVALNYCITYEVAPPEWRDPVGRYLSLDAGRPGAWRPADSPAGQLSGELSGDLAATCQRLDAELAGAEGPLVSCASLLRVDVAAAASLLRWVMACDAKGRRVEFVDVHRLLAAFFGVAGIADHAAVTPRP
ncbi:MAG: STAS domain-containing protein [Xenophilus sp.]